MAYQASLVVLDARVLFSPVRVTAAFDPAVTGTKAVVEEHHLFPRGYLATQGVTERKQVSQIANFALLEWPDNVKVGAAAPSNYAPSLDAAISKESRFHHALPTEWWAKPYETFLSERRLLMAEVVRAAWERLRGGPRATDVAPTIDELIASGETEGVEFKATLRTNLHTGQADDKIQMAALKTIAAFMNAGGGTLLIGVADDGVVTGLSADKFANDDKMGLHLVNLMRDRIGDLFLPYVHPEFVEQEGGRVLSVRCERGPKPAFVKEGTAHRFFVRGANATTELFGQSVVDYCEQRFK
jgi:Putative DNA-binding domain